jgi:hypothetical protein
MGPLLQDADVVAEIVSLVLQSLMGDDPDGLSELGLTMMMAGTTPVVTRVSALVNPDVAARAHAGRKTLRKMAQAMGVPYEEMAQPQGEELPSALNARAGDPVHRKVIERELAHERIWIQPSGQVAVQTCDGIDKFQSMDDLVEDLKGKAIEALQEEIEVSNSGDELKTAMANKASKRARHRLRLAIEMSFLSAKDAIRTRVAGVYPSSIAGPYAHLELPIQERVFELHEGDDWLTDREKAISALPRYNPEYEKAGSMTSDEGFYFVWDEQNRSPVDWLNVLRGDTIYKTRNLLSPGKLY